MDKIVITYAPIHANKDNIFSMAKDDENLISAIQLYSKDQSMKGVEIFERKQNIIATENGYYMAFFEGDLEGT